MPWAPEIYLGTPVKDGIVRQNALIGCMDPTFENYVCMSKDDLNILYKFCLDKVKTP